MSQRHTLMPATALLMWAALVTVMTVTAEAVVGVNVTADSTHQHGDGDRQ